MQKSTITPRVYAQAFEDWARVNVHFDDDERAEVRNIAARIAEAFQPDAELGISVLCAFAQKVPRKHLRSTTAAKSALLWRLIYLQEPLRTVQCPTHQGRMDTAMWVGLRRPPCLYGCEGSGWLHALPERLTLRLDHVTYSWPREAGRGAALVTDYVAAHHELHGVSDPTTVLVGMLRNVIADHLDALALVEPSFRTGGAFQDDPPPPPSGLTNRQFQALMAVITNPTAERRRALKEAL